MKKTSKSQKPIIGIDLGTTNSSAAYIKDGQAEIIPSPGGERIIPSVVHVDRAGKVVVGQDAADALIAMPGRTIAAVKRKMGSEEHLEVAGKKLLPEEVSALILKELKEYADNLLGPGEKEAVISVPAHFADAQRKATKKAGELAGFTVERVINEPTAAAMAFGLSNLDQDQHILVYDLGGGTFDVSLVEMMEGVLEVKASAGDNNLGGEDFDWKLVELFVGNMEDKYGVNPMEDLRAKTLLKGEAERVKKELSVKEACSVNLPAVIVKDDQPLDLELEVSRNEFVELIKDSLEKTLGCVEQVLEDASLDPEEIDEVLLVGGSTRIPWVREALAENFSFGNKPRQDINPEEAVALGVAVQAGLKSGELAESGFIVTDVAPYSLGIAVLKGFQGIMMVPGGFHTIIPKNTTIPVTRSDRFSTAADGQTVVEIEVYQGEKEWTRDNYPLGEFLLSGIPPRPAGQEEVEVTFHYNINGILEVQARCVSNNKAMGVSLKDALDRKSEGSYKESLERLETIFDAAEEPSEEDMDDFLAGFQEMEEESQEGIKARLKKEALLAIADGKELLSRLPQKARKELAELLESLEGALEGPDEDLQEALNEVLDLLIEIDEGDENE